MTTAAEIINRSLKEIGRLAAGEAPTSEDSADCLVALNAIIEFYQTEQFAAFSEIDRSFSVTASTGQYAIGDTVITGLAITQTSGTATATTPVSHSLETGNLVTIGNAVQAGYNTTAAVTYASQTSFTYSVATATASPATSTSSISLTNANFNMPRPVDVLGAFVRASALDYPLGVVTERYWNSISNKASTAALPTKMLYRPAYPFGQVLMWPVPTSTQTLHVKTRNVVGTYSLLTSDQLLPPGYFRLLTLALAMDIAPQYGGVVSEELKANFASSLQFVFGLNAAQSKSAADNLSPAATRSSVNPIAQTKQG